MEYITYTNKNDISKWLNAHKIYQYYIDDNNNVYIEGDVDLTDWGLEYLPIKLGPIQGKFDISRNRLRTLMNFPLAVFNDFDISNNDLESLEFGPTIVKGNYICYHNRIKSMKYCARKINGTLDISWNSLRDLKSCPKDGVKELDCSHNYLTNLDDLFITSIKPYEVNYKYNNQLSQESVDVFWSFYLNNHPEYVDFINRDHRVSSSIIMRYCYMKNRAVSIADGTVYDISSDVKEYLLEKKLIEFSAIYHEWIIPLYKLEEALYYIEKLTKVF